MTEPVPGYARFIGVDYSGAEMPESGLKGLRVFVATPARPPEEVLPPPAPSRYWKRRDLAAWLVEQLAAGSPTIVGIDHAFSFPMRYFETHRLDPNWQFFLDDFQTHWPTDGEFVYVDSVRDGAVGNGAARPGNTRWRRLTERRAGGAKPVFHFDVPGSVAKSTHAGLPWLRTMRQQLGSRVHFWPFEGWSVPLGSSTVLEVYPSLWSRGYPREGRTPDQHDAWTVAEWLRQRDADASLAGFFRPPLSEPERAEADVEGWILGVM